MIVDTTIEAGRVTVSRVEKLVVKFEDRRTVHTRGLMAHAGCHCR
jgi:hypothetical protein